VVEQRDVFPRAAEQDGAFDLIDRNTRAIPFAGQLLIGGREHPGDAARGQEQTANGCDIDRLFRVVR
jgi:hypothetical protein